MNKLVVTDIDICGKRVLYRADYNVPMISDVISDTSRITSTYPTLLYILSQDIKQIIITSHLGRPKGVKDPKLSLFPVYQLLKSFLRPYNIDLMFYEMYDSGILSNKYIFLENLRFYSAEENYNSADSENYIEFLNKCGDLLVVDAFGVLHRDCTSITRIQMQKVAGLLVQRELSAVESIFPSVLKFLKNRSHNLEGLSCGNPDIFDCKKMTTSSNWQNVLKNKTVDVLFLGGKKVWDKAKFIKNLIPICKHIYIFGAMCFPFLTYKKRRIGATQSEDLALEILDEIYDLSRLNDTTIHLPKDFICVHRAKIKETHNRQTNAIGEENNIAPNDKSGYKQSKPHQNEGFLSFFENSDGNVYRQCVYPNYNESIVDIGEETLLDIKNLLHPANVILWNGTPGIFEVIGSHQGTKELVRILMDLHPQKRVIVGGGDTGFAVSKFGAMNLFYHVSTGGGAFLALLQGDSLPGIDAIQDKGELRSEK